MKILLAVDCYRTQINGVNTSVKMLYDELKKRGNDVRILALSEDAKSKTINSNYYLSSFRSKLIYPRTRIALLNNKNIEENINGFTYKEIDDAVNKILKLSNDKRGKIYKCLTV